MIGAIIGDIVGSVYEYKNIKTTQFPLFIKNSEFTDDTVLTVAVADALLNKKAYQHALRDWGRKYPDAGYGNQFGDWLFAEDSAPYNSYGNGSAMRVCPIGYAFNTLEAVLNEAQKSAEITHNHPEGIKGAKAIAAAVFLAKQGESKKAITAFIEKEFAYDLNKSIAEIRSTYHYDITCQGTVPPAIMAFMEAKDFEDAIRLAISVGGDSDTVGCITGSIAEAYYKKIPEFMISETIKRLPTEMIEIIRKFQKQYLNSNFTLL